MNHWVDTNDWMTKRVIFPPINDRGEQVVNWITTEDSSLVKTAAAKKTTYHDKIASYIEQVKPRKDMACCVISALGSYEAWGQNINGDRFPRIMFIEGQHKTYEKNGFPYKHHLNKPHLGHPQYGEKVLMAEFNPKMDRVELIVWYDLTKDSDLLSDIERGNVGVSMGMKTPYDACTIVGCGNVAKKPDEYCIHSHKDKRRAYGYYMGMILPDGQQIGRWNRYANFFDISRVIIPAWQPGRILEKVASTGQKFWNIDPAWLEGSAYLGKKAESEKQADIVKQVPSLEQSVNAKAVDFMNMAQDIQAVEPELPKQLLDELAEKNDFKKLISTMLTMGIVPKPKEFQRMALVKIGCKNLADKFEKEGILFTQVEPIQPKNYDIIDVDSKYCSEKIASEFEPYLEDRSCLTPFLYNRLEKIAANQNLLLPQINLEGKKQDKRDLGREALKTLAGIGGIYAILRGLIGGKPIEAGGKKLLPTMAELGGTIPPGSKIEKSIEGFMGSNPALKLILLAALGGGLLKAIQAATKPNIITNYDQPLDTPPLVSYNDVSSYNQVAERNKTPLVKLGAWDPDKYVSLFKGPRARTVGKTLMRAAIGLPAFYMISGTLEAKRQSDPFSEKSEGTVGGLLRKHPGIAATAFTFAPQAKDVVLSMMKKGSVGEDIRDWALFGAMAGGNAALGITGGVADALLINAASKAAKAISNKMNKRRTLKLN